MVIVMMTLMTLMKMIMMCVCVCVVKVWMSVDWNHSDGIDQSTESHPKSKSVATPVEEKKINFDYTNGARGGGYSISMTDLLTNPEPPTPSEVTAPQDSPLTNPILTAPPSPGCEDTDFLARKPLVENITLKMFPMYYDEGEVQPKVSTHTHTQDMPWHALMCCVAM